jgi:pimeloyl-ACP methyl ester carboxylesterase
MMADDLAGLLSAVGISQAHVLGFALGGCIAQQFALKYPGRVRSLILAATSACPSVEAPRAMFIANTILKLAKAGIDAGTRTRVMIPWALTRKFFEDPAKVQMAIRLTQAVPRPQTVEGLSGQVYAGLSHDARQALPSITAPTMVLVASRDNVLPLALSESLVRRIPGAELKVLDEGGHLCFYEVPEAFNAAVLGFVGRFSGDGERPTAPA